MRFEDLFETMFAKGMSKYKTNLPAEQSSGFQKYLITNRTFQAGGDRGLQKNLSRLDLIHKISFIC